MATVANKNTSSIPYSRMVHTFGCAHHFILKCRLLRRGIGSCMTAFHKSDLYALNIFQSCDCILQLNVSQSISLCKCYFCNLKPVKILVFLSYVSFNLCKWVSRCKRDIRTYMLSYLYVQYSPQWTNSIVLCMNYCPYVYIIYQSVL